MTIEQIYSPDGFNSPQISANVRQIGFRSLTAQVCADSDTRLPNILAPVIVSFLREDQLYRFESVVQKIGHRGDETTIVLQRPKRVVKVQRRFSYRVPMETRTVYRLLGAMPQADAEFPAKIVNISEGGMLITTVGPIYTGALLSITIPLGSGEDPMEVKAEVLETMQNEHSSQEMAIARVRFDNCERVYLTDDQRKRLVHYLFEQQRLMLQTRRLINPAKKRA